MLYDIDVLDSARNIFGSVKCKMFTAMKCNSLEMLCGSKV